MTKRRIRAGSVKSAKRKATSKGRVVTKVRYIKGTKKRTKKKKRKRKSKRKPYKKKVTYFTMDIR